MTYHLFSNKRRLLKDTSGLTFIEVLIVMLITGMTLVALLNITTHDILVESLNEEQDTGNYVAVSQLQEFQSIISLNDLCLDQMYTDYTSSGYNTYYACNSPSYSGLTPVNSCKSSNPNQTWFLYEARSAGGISAKTCNSTLSPTNINYYEDLKIQSVSRTSSGTTIDLTSDVNWTDASKTAQNDSIEQEFLY